MITLLPFRSRSRAVLAAAAAVLLGVMSGRALPPEGATDSGTDDTQIVADQADMGGMLGFLDELLDDLVASEGGGE